MRKRASIMPGMQSMEMAQAAPALAPQDSGGDPGGGLQPQWDGGDTATAPTNSLPLGSVTHSGEAATSIRQGVGFNGTGNAKEAAQNDRARIASTGDTLDYDLKNRINDQSSRAQTANDATTAGIDELRTTPGYTPQEEAQILRTQNTQNLGQLSNGDYQSRFLSPEEQAGAIGNPNKVAGDYGNELDQVTADAMRELGLTIDPHRLQQDPQYAAQVKQIANEYAQKRVYSDADVEQMGNTGARDVGLRYQAAIQDAERAAAAGGARDPNALNAVRSRFEQASSRDAADARVDAELKGREAQKQSFDAATGLQTQVLGNVENQRMQGGQNLTTALMQKAATGADITNRAAAQRVAANQTAEQALAGRMFAVGTNRQATETGAQDDANKRGVAAETALSQRNQTVGDARIAGQAQARNLTFAQQQQADNNVNTAWNQRLGANGLAVNGGNQATSNLNTANATPGMGERIAGTIIGAAGGVAAAAAGKADGGVFMEPTQVTVGEAGPEMIVPVGSGYGGHGPMQGGGGGPMQGGHDDGMGGWGRNPPGGAPSMMDPGGVQPMHQPQPPFMLGRQRPRPRFQMPGIPSNSGMGQSSRMTNPAYA